MVARCGRAAHQGGAREKDVIDRDAARIGVQDDHARDPRLAAGRLEPQRGDAFGQGCDDPAQDAPVPRKKDRLDHAARGRAGAQRIGVIGMDQHARRGLVLIEQDRQRSFATSRQPAEAVRPDGKGRVRAEAAMPRHGQALPIRPRGQAQRAIGLCRDKAVMPPPVPPGQDAGGLSLEMAGNGKARCVMGRAQQMAGFVAQRPGLETLEAVQLAQQVAIGPADDAFGPRRRGQHAAYGQAQQPDYKGCPGTARQETGAKPPIAQPCHIRSPK